MSTDYKIGYNEGTQKLFSMRTAQDQAGFLLPHLKPGMKILDCGCGPGTITKGLAVLVNPGEVVGIDLEQSQIDVANEHELPNLSFRQADLFDLPFSDGDFDVVYANAVICHQFDQKEAINSLKRVIKLGGLLALRDPDIDSLIVNAKNPEVIRCYQMIYKLMGRKGDFRSGKKLKGYLHECGFEEVIATASCKVRSSEMDRVQICDHQYQQWGEAPWATSAIEEGLVSKAEVDSFRGALLEAKNDPTFS